MRRIGILTCLSVIAVLAFVFTRGSSKKPSTVVAKPAAITIAPTFERGVEHAYDVSFVQVVNNGKNDFRVALDGSWAVAFAGSDARGLVFRAQLRDGKPTVQHGAIDATSAFAATLARPYYFTTTTDGRLVAMHFGKDVDDLARGALTTLAATFQHSRSENAIESDSLGDYEAHYLQRGAELHRDRVRYQRVVGDLQTTIVKTGTDITMFGVWPQTVAGTEVTKLGTDELAVTVDTRFSLKLVSVSHVDAGWHDGLEVSAVDAASGARSTEEADRELVDGASLSDLLAELARVGDDAHARGYQFLRIAALLRLDGDAVHVAERAVLANEATAPVLIAALGEAGTPEAQQSLGKILAAPLAEEARTHAAASLGLVEAPTAATLVTLEAATHADGDVASTATLAQGNAALRMRDDDPASADRQIDALLARYARATDDEERALVLRALGNTGDAKIVPAIQQAFASKSILVRVAATEALRLVPGVDALVLGRLADDAALVRSAAVFAASQRDLGAYVAAFERAVKSDELEVRRAVVELVGARLSESDGLRAIVEYAAAHEADGELRAIAKQFLAPS